MTEQQDLNERLLEYGARIIKEEMRESNYWLRLPEASAGGELPYSPLLDEFR